MVWPLLASKPGTLPVALGGTEKICYGPVLRSQHQDISTSTALILTIDFKYLSLSNDPTLWKSSFLKYSFNTVSQYQNHVVITRLVDQ